MRVTAGRWPTATPVPRSGSVREPAVSETSWAPAAPGSRTRSGRPERPHRVRRTPTGSGRASRRSPGEPTWPAAHTIRAWSIGGAPGPGRRNDERNTLFRSAKSDNDGTRRARRVREAHRRRGKPGRCGSAGLPRVGFWGAGTHPRQKVLTSTQDLSDVGAVRGVDSLRRGGLRALVQQSPNDRRRQARSFLTLRRRGQHWSERCRRDPLALDGSPWSRARSSAARRLRCARDGPGKAPAQRSPA